jgi:metal-responsive CopG/Arc/MetJ family transcriptional regulator
MPKGDPWTAIELKLPPDVLRVVDLLARERGVNRSEFIRRAIQTELLLEHLRRERASGGSSPLGRSE